MSLLSLLKQTGDDSFIVRRSYSFVRGALPTILLSGGKKDLWRREMRRRGGKRKRHLFWRQLKKNAPHTPAPINLVGDMDRRRPVVSSSSSSSLQLHPPPSVTTTTSIVSAAAPKNTMSAIKAWSVQEKNGLQDFIKVCVRSTVELDEKKMM